MVTITDDYDNHRFQFSNNIPDNARPLRSPPETGNGPATAKNNLTYDADLAVG